MFILTGIVVYDVLNVNLGYTRSSDTDIGNRYVMKYFREEFRDTRGEITVQRTESYWNDTLHYLVVSFKRKKLCL